MTGKKKVKSFKDVRHDYCLQRLIIIKEQQHICHEQENTTTSNVIIEFSFQP